MSVRESDGSVTEETELPPVWVTLVQVIEWSGGDFRWWLPLLPSQVAAGESVPQSADQFAIWTSPSDAGPESVCCQEPAQRAVWHPSRCVPTLTSHCSAHNSPVQKTWREIAAMKHERGNVCMVTQRIGTDKVRFLKAFEVKGYWHWTF